MIGFLTQQQDTFTVGLTSRKIQSITSYMFNSRIKMVFIDAVIHLSACVDTKRQTSGKGPPAEGGGRGLKEAQGF